MYSLLRRPNSHLTYKQENAPQPASTQWPCYHELRQECNISFLGTKINELIIHSKYFPDSDWLKAQA